MTRQEMIGAKASGVGADASPATPTSSAAPVRSGKSIVEFAERRLELAGGRFLEGGHPWFRPTDALAMRCKTAGIPYVSFAHYDYLGLGETPALKNAAAAALADDGSSAGASRLVGGERVAHARLETDLADFLGYEKTLVTISAYLANASLIPHLLGRRDMVITDALAHNSLAMGARYARCKHETFAHNDLDALEEVLAAERGSVNNVLICVDALYSMDGDVVDLPRLIEIKKRYGCWLLLDEAHSFGTLGPTGAGLREAAGVDPADVEFITGSMSKSLSASGGFIAAPATVIEWLRFTLPSFVYSVGLAPVAVHAAQAALTGLRREPERLGQLRANARAFAEAARSAGLTVLGTDGGPVQAVLFRSMEETLATGAFLEENGVYAPPIAHVGVPSDAPRIRFFLTAMHTKAQIDRTVGLLVEATGLAPELRKAAP